MPDAAEVVSTRSGARSPTSPWWMLLVLCPASFVLARVLAAPWSWGVPALVNAVGLTLAAIALVRGAAAARRAREHLLHAGWRGAARIVDTTETSTRINKKPVYVLRLELEVPRRGRYVAEHETVVPLMHVHRLQPGQTVPVLVDPEDPAHMQIDWDA